MMSTTRLSSDTRSARPVHDERWHRRFLFPMLVVLLLLGLIPLVYTVYLSVTDSASQSLLNRTPAGFGSYGRLVADGQFWNALWLQIVFVVGSVVLELVLGFFIALGLNRDTRFMRTARSLLLAPAVLPTVVVALLFSYLLQSKVGAISFYVDKLGLPTDWLDHGPSAMAVLVGIDAWQFTPLVAILLLAGLQGIPTEYMEAAAIDGAGSVRRTLEITLPVLAPIILTVGLLRMIDAVQVFPTIYILTRGGPGTTTNVLNFWGFTVFFQNSDTTYGATIAVVLTLGTVIVAAIFAFVLRKQLRGNHR